MKRLIENEPTLLHWFIVRFRGYVPWFIILMVALSWCVGRNEKNNKQQQPCQTHGKVFNVCQRSAVLKPYILFKKLPECSIKC